VDTEILHERVLSLITESQTPLSARELGSRIDADSYELRSALFNLRRADEIGAELGPDNETLVYAPLPDGVPPQVAGLTTRGRGNGTSGHRANGKPNGSAARDELLAIIEAMAENPILVRLVKLYGSL
jgi:hypothetical protein